MTQVFDSCDLLPGTLGEERLRQASETCPVSESRKLRLELWSTATALAGH